MSDQAPDARQPLVVLDVDYANGVFELVLVNIGADAARDISVGFTRKLLGAGGVIVSDLPIFSRLRTLRPGKEIRVFVDSAVDLFRRRKTNAFGSVVKWKDAAGKDHRASYRHDLDAYRGLPELIHQGRNDHA